MPLTSCVFPAPRSPLKPMTQPWLASRPQASPMASVSSGLREMSVAMYVKRPNAILVPEPQPGFSRDFSDAAQARTGEFLSPASQELDLCVLGNGEVQLDVLAIG